MSYPCSSEPRTTGIRHVEVVPIALRREFAAMEMRASGRVTPDVLSPVRVQLPGAKEAVKLDAVSTVGVREGNTLIVTVFEEQVSKFRS